MKTTLNKIRECKPCSGGWETLLKSLNKNKPDDEELCLLTILESNGLKDTLWCLRAVEGYDREKRLFAVWCAKQVKHLMKDQRSLDALKIAEDFAEGRATEKELKAVHYAAEDDYDAARASQQKEFIRMLTCIKNNEQYEIN